MGGKMEAWGASVKRHDQLIRGLREQLARTIDSLVAIQSNLEKLGEETDSAAVRAAHESGIDYEPGGHLRNPFEPLDLLIQTLDGPRHLMTDEEVKFFRDRIRASLKLIDANQRESTKLASTSKRNRDDLKRLEQFYTPPSKRRAAGKSRKRAPKRRR